MRRIFFCFCLVSLIGCTPREQLADPVVTTTRLQTIPPVTQVMPPATSTTAQEPKYQIPKRAKIPMIWNNGVTIYAWRNPNTKAWEFDYLYGKEHAYTRLEIKQFSQNYYVVKDEQLLRSILNNTHIFYYLRGSNNNLKESDIAALRELFAGHSSHIIFEGAGDDVAIAEAARVHAYMQTIFVNLNLGENKNCKLAYCFNSRGLNDNAFIFSAEETMQVGVKAYHANYIMELLKVNGDKTWYIKGLYQELNQEDIKSLQSIFYRMEDYWRIRYENQKVIT